MLPDTTPDASTSSSPWASAPGPHGTVTIPDEVVAQVVGLTVLECYGVVGMASTRLVDGVGRLLGRDAVTKGVSVTRGVDGPAVEVHLVIGHGLNLAEVADTVRARVEYQVARLTGTPVASLGIHVQGVRRPDG